MNSSKLYKTNDSYTDISFNLPYEAREIGGSIFQFKADYYVEKDLPIDEENDFYGEHVPVFKVFGHTGDFDTNYSDIADAISESTIENYAFASGLYEQLFDSEFNNTIFERTALIINRWLSIENVFVCEEIKNCSEDVQAELFGHFLLNFKQTWKELFLNDVTLATFSEGLYVSPEKRAQNTVITAYQKAGFFATLNRQEFIENNELDIKLKTMFEMDFNNNLFSGDVKNPERKQYSGFIYTPCTL